MPSSREHRQRGAVGITRERHSRGEPNGVWAGVIVMFGTSE